MSVAMEGIAVGATSLPATGWGSPGCGAVIKLEERDVIGILKVNKKDHQHLHYTNSKKKVLKFVWRSGKAAGRISSLSHIILCTKNINLCEMQNYSPNGTRRAKALRHITLVIWQVVYTSKI